MGDASNQRGGEIEREEDFERFQGFMFFVELLLITNIKY
jgi:hypothetical protein